MDIGRYSAEDVKQLLNSDKINDEDRTTLYIAYLFLSDDTLNVLLKGAYSLYVNNLILKDKVETRKTSDLNFKLLKIDDVEGYIKEWCNNKKINLLKIKQTKAGNYKIRLSSPIVGSDRKFIEGTSFIIPVDLEISEEVQNGIATYKEVMKEKLNLKLNLMDRRLKDLVDFIVNLKIYYPEGITKKELYDYIGDKEQIRKACKESNMEDCLEQSKTFNPKVINGIPVEECISQFFVMLNGLIDNNILDNWVFYNGYWNRT